jgi:hypothetical protein
VKYWDEPVGVAPTRPSALIVGRSCSCWALLNF